MTALYRVELTLSEERHYTAMTEIEAADPEQAMRLAREQVKAGVFYAPDMHWTFNAIVGQDVWPSDVLDDNGESMLP